MNQNYQLHNDLNISADTDVQQDPQLLPLSHLMAQHFPPIEWLVDELVPEDSVVLLSGAPSSFKTWFALEMVKSITSKSRFLGQFDTKPTNVLIMDAESGERQLYDRFSKLDVNPESGVYYSCCNGAYLNKDFADKLEAECWSKDIKLVIFDSLVRFHNGDENSAKDMSKVFESFQYLKNRGITSLILCHTRKSSNGAGQTQRGNMDAIRGSGDILAACDVSLSMYRSEQNQQVVIYPNRNKHKPEANPFTAYFVKESQDRSSWRFGKIMEKKEDIVTHNTELVMSFIENNPGKNQQQILNYLQNNNESQIYSDKPLRSILAQLASEKAIYCKHGKGKELLYYATTTSDDADENEEPQNV